MLGAGCPQARRQPTITQQALGQQEGRASHTALALGSLIQATQ